MRKLLIWILLLLPMAARAETALTIEPLSGSEKQYALSLIGQVRFAADVMYIFDVSGVELGHTAIPEVGKIVFREESTISTSTDNVVSARLQVYPNPTHDFIIIQGLENEQTARVYSWEGKMLTTTQTNEKETKINVSDLPNGSYLLQVGAEIVKFIKK